MKAIKKDLNFFTVYSKGPGKAGKKALQGVFLLILSFILLVVGAYIALFFLEANLENKTTVINTALSLPQAVESQKEISALQKKNQLMSSYYASLAKAKKGFDDSRVIDAELFNALSGAMPTTVKLQTITVTPQNMVLSCTCTDKLAPAVFSQSLKKTGLFSSITYSGFTADAANEYTFHMTCYLGEK